MDLEQGGDEASLLRADPRGVSSQAASLAVGVSPSCGSLWFIDAGPVHFVETPISRRYLSQDDRIEIVDGLARGEPVKQIAVRIGKSYQSVYREIARNRKSDGRYQPWFAHNRAYERRRRTRPRRFVVDAELRELVAGKAQQALGRRAKIPDPYRSPRASSGERASSLLRSSLRSP